MPRDPASEQLSQWKATNGNAKQACVLHVKRGQCSAVAALVPAPVSKKTMVLTAGNGRPLDNLTDVQTAGPRGPMLVQ
eukprot:16594-Heterococcus_DN1.PRE.2